MARRNNSRKLPNRPRNLPLVGDPTPLPPLKYIDKNTTNKLLNQQTIEEYLETLSEDELFNVALSVGVKATDALGVNKCYEHYGYKELGGRHVPNINYATDVVYCRNCFTYYYSKG